MNNPGERRLPMDEITAELRALARELAERLVGAGEVSAPSSDGVGEGFEVRPTAAGPVEIWLMHDADGILVGLDKCRGWELPRELKSVDIAKAIVVAAVAGSLEIGSGVGVRAYRLILPDGTVMNDASEGFAALLQPWKPRLRWRSATPYG